LKKTSILEHRVLGERQVGRVLQSKIKSEIKAFVKPNNLEE
jgi:hypothetical protein